MNTRVSASNPGPPAAFVSLIVSVGPPEVGVTPPRNVPGTTVMLLVAVTPPVGLPVPATESVAAPGARALTDPSGLGSTFARVVSSLEKVGAGTPATGAPAASRYWYPNNVVAPDPMLSGPVITILAGNVAICTVSDNPAASAMTQLVP